MPLEAGAVFDERYRVVSALGDGARGEVYEVEDLHLGVRLALKQLNPQWAANPTALENFQREMKLVAGIDHPNVRRIYGFYTQGTVITPAGVPAPATYLTMELLRGETLAERMHRLDGIAPADVVPILRHAAAGLDAIHAAGILHLELNPGKIFLAGDRVVLTGFRRTMRAAGDKPAPEILGTAVYMSPEQVKGEALTPASDIYSFGVVLYEALTGRLPFEGTSTLDRLRAQLTQPPRPPREVARWIPEGLQETMLRCLAREPGERPKTASQLVALLRLWEPSLPPYPPDRSNGCADIAAEPDEVEPTATLRAPLPQMPAPRAGPATAAAGAPPESHYRPAGTPSAEVAASPQPLREVEERALDLALAPSVPVGLPTELIALLRLTDSRGLAELLRNDRDTDLTGRDVRSRNFAVDFLHDAAGRLQPLEATMRVSAPGFEPDLIDKRIRIRPGEDCERQSFLLTPKAVGSLRVQFDLLVERVTLASRTLKVGAEPAGASAAQPVVVSVPLEVRVLAKKNRLLKAAVAIGAVLLLGEGIWAVHDWRQRHAAATETARGFKAPVEHTTPSAVSDSAIAAAKNDALLVAQDIYQYWPALRNPGKDTEDIGRELEQVYGFKVRRLYNGTRDQIWQSIKSYHDGSHGPADQLFVYIAGHGTFDESENRGFLIAADSRQDDTLHTTQISHDDLRAVLDSLPIPHIFVVIDACFGGTFDPRIDESAHRGAPEGGIPLATLRQRRASQTTRQFLTSGSKEYVSDGLGANSPFARVFLEALRGSEGSGEYLTIARLRPYFERTQGDARQGEFGHDVAGSEFFFVPVK